MTHHDTKSFKEEFEQLLATVRSALYTGNNPLARACHYALLGEGKRIRPLLAMHSNIACGGDGKSALQAALALEMIHTYSLVHDDLPCLDNDALRRGRPTLHIAFDEPTALLAGDALLTDAFRVLSASSLAMLHPELARLPALNAERRIFMVEALAFAAGGAGMVFGQTLDMHFTRQQSPSREDLDLIHANKTGRLIAAACQLGAMSAPHSQKEDWERCRTFGQTIGLVFQITDDLLDGAATMGKSAGKDIAQGKLTYLRLMSADDARREAARLTSEAMSLMTPLGAPAAGLTALAMALLQRNH